MATPKVDHIKKTLSFDHVLMNDGNKKNWSQNVKLSNAECSLEW